MLASLEDVRWALVCLSIGHARRLKVKLSLLSLLSLWQVVLAHRVMTIPLTRGERGGGVMLLLKCSLEPSCMYNIRALLPLVHLPVALADCDKQQNKLRGLQSTRELYRPSGRHSSAKLVPTFVDRGVSRGQRTGSHVRFRLSRPEPLQLSS
jgi:hypothetical protein